MKFVLGSMQSLLLMVVVVGLMCSCGEPTQEPSPSWPEEEVLPEPSPSGESEGSSSVDAGVPEQPDAGVVPITPPEILESWSSVSSTPGGRPVTLRVRARPPHEGTLGFSWQVEAGTLSAPSHSATSSEIIWTAPACGAGLATHTVHVSLVHSSGLAPSAAFRISVVCPQWESTGGMVSARYDHTASLLPSGKVLVIGRYAGDARNSVEEYDPAASTWSGKEDMLTGRRGHTASVLPSGQVLVTGGYNNLEGIIKTAERYDPVAVRPQWASAGRMSESRTAHTATVLPSGKVFVVGGFGVGGALMSAELYEGSAEEPGKWTPRSSMGTGRYGHTATLLPSGKILVVGGYGPMGPLADAELYDPESDSWTSAGSPSSAARAYHTATLLPSGQVLVAGGETADAALYDPTSNRWLQVGSMAMARAHHTATVLPSGKVLVVGGMATSSLASTEVYDPSSQTWSPGAPLSTARSHHAACLLPSGQVLVTGGHASSGPLNTAELYVDPQVD